MRSVVSADCDVVTGSRDIVTSRRKSILAGTHQATRDPSQPISVLLEPTYLRNGESEKMTL